MNIYGLDMGQKFDAFFSNKIDTGINTFIYNS